MSATSISDGAGYLRVCAEAAASDSTFDIFRQDPEYRQILEHTSLEQAVGYIHFVIQHSPHYLSHLSKLREVDRFGGPEVVSFGDFIGIFSTSAWRYIKVLSDLAMMFGDLSGFRIVEIGGGYGGQCAVISSLFPLSDYIIFDLPEPLALQRKFLERNEIGNVSFRTEAQLPETLECDLLISNYAITELVQPLADRYIDRCVRHAQRAYITGNQIASFCLSREEMMARLPHAVAIAEMPLTHPDNYILTWRKQSAGYRPDPYRPIAPVFVPQPAQV
jgi:O-methyltransferase domain